MIRDKSEFSCSAGAQLAKVVERLVKIRKCLALVLRSFALLKNVRRQNDKSLSRGIEGEGEMFMPA
jgi:hypothetical protein